MSGGYERTIAAKHNRKILQNVVRPIPWNFSQFARRCIGWLASAEFGPPSPPPRPPYTDGSDGDADGNH
jgi:hypothetical protein